MKNNTVLLIGAAALVYFYFMKKKKAAVLPPNETETFNKSGGSRQIELIRSQTVNFAQLAPTPSSILDLPESLYNSKTEACNCCNQGRLSGMPFVC
jgi:hypothetical protein